MSVLFPALPGGAQRKVSFSCSVFGLHARSPLYQNDKRTLRRRRALRRLVKSPATKAKLRPTGADQRRGSSLCLCQQKGTILMTHRSWDPPLCVLRMHYRQCCQGHWHLSLVRQCPSARHSSSAAAAAARTWSSSTPSCPGSLGLSRAALWMPHSTTR